jgi:hypothetical protein
MQMEAIQPKTLKAFRKADKKREERRRELELLEISRLEEEMRNAAPSVPSRTVSSAGVVHTPSTPPLHTQSPPIPPRPIGQIPSSISFIHTGPTTNPIPRRPPVISTGSFVPPHLHRNNVAALGDEHDFGQRYTPEPMSQLRRALTSISPKVTSGISSSAPSANPARPSANKPLPPLPRGSSGPVAGPSSAPLVETRHVT